jgi:glycosyltransferase involved in cell wall biosynthesis
MQQKRKFHYILLESNAISDGIGGKVHIQGVIRGLSDQLDLSVVGLDLDLLPYQDKFFTKVDLSNKGKSLAFYREVLAYIWNAGGDDVFLYRKTLIGIIFLFPLLWLKKILCPKQLHIVEMNGVSGDFRGYAPWKSSLMAYINALLVWPFDKIYAVNNNIAERLVGTKLLAKDKVVICKNGCFGPQFNFVDLSNLKDSPIRNINFVFYGSLQKHYALLDFVEAIKKYGQRNPEINFVVHFIGPRFEELDLGPFVKMPGAMNLVEFATYIKKMGLNTWGLLPLRFTEGKTDVLPIKILDYISCGLPILSTFEPLEFHGRTQQIVFTYNLNNQKSVFELLDYVVELSSDEILKLREGCLQIAEFNDWKKTLMPLNNCLA